MIRNTFFALLVLVAFASCTATRSTIREPYSRVDFSKTDFEFSPSVTAEADQTIILGFDFSRLFNQSTSAVAPDFGGNALSSLPIIGGFLQSKVTGYAMQNLMTANPAYDVIFYPAVTVRRSRPVLGIPFIFEKRHAIVKARLAKIK